MGLVSSSITGTEIAKKSVGIKIPLAQNQVYSNKANGPLLAGRLGGVAEWSIAAVFKTAGGKGASEYPRGFESHRLRPLKGQKRGT